jgi:hypothetical protein
VTRKTPVLRFALIAALAAFALALVPVAFADKGGGGGGNANAPAKGGGKGSGGSSSTTSSATTTSGCTSTPRVAITNTWSWQMPGSWGLPGQQLKYAILVFNDDVGCGSSTFAISMSAPDGFSVSIPTSTITLASGSSGYLWAYVTSPSVVADGDYPVTVAVERGGTSSPTGSSTSYYKVYSSDTVAPRLYLPSPSDGVTISGRSYSVGVASSDDHAVKQIDLYIDNVYTSTSVCGGTSYECRLYYKWAIRKVRGQHTATFNSSDWMGNVGTLTVTFTVN